MKNKNYYIYKFFNKENELLYVGQTNNLHRRMSEHSRDKVWWNEVKSVQFAECKSDVDKYEIYYINKLKPNKNISLINKDISDFKLEELHFINHDGHIPKVNNFTKRFNSYNIDNIDDVHHISEIDFNRLKKNSLIEMYRELFLKYKNEKEYYNMYYKLYESEKIKTIELKHKIDQLEKTGIYTKEKMINIIKEEIDIIQNHFEDYGISLWATSIHSKLIKCDYILDIMEVVNYICEYSPSYKLWVSKQNNN